jgi:hypothetical protein
MYGKSISYISRAINIEPSVITYSTDVYIYVMEKMNHVSSILPLQVHPPLGSGWLSADNISSHPRPVHADAPHTHSPC